MAEGRTQRGRRGFRQTASLVTGQIRTVSERRGFVEARLLTDWAAIVGPALASVATPVRVSYAKGGFGATLVLRCEGARAPELSLARETIRAQVNACYGYNAIQRVQITQTGGGDNAAPGFAEPKTPFQPKPAAVTEAARKTAAPVADDGLRGALERLGETILSGAPGDQTRKD
ncbi:MAG: DciA family protein [Pseudomonadota bacterium]